ncbi:MAG: CPBP family intramembrane metalloprotease [Bacteroidales bacterium]|nr:CPBP family intramembrane metalloprotease [Bacteroidales bacterium]
MVKIRWQFVVIFYIIAFSLSAPFNSGLLNPWYRALTKSWLISDMSYLPACLGTLIAGIVVLLIDKSHQRTITFLGNYRLRNIAISITPVVAFSIIGLDNSFGQNRYQFALSYGVINLIYSVFEEFGWRGYLQDELRPLKKGISFLIIGILWWVWHFRYATTFDLTIFPLICIGGSFLIGQFTEKTKSYLTAGGLHCLIILLTNSGDITRSKMIAIALTGLIWVGISFLWKPELPITHNK